MGISKAYFNHYYKENVFSHCHLYYHEGRGTDVVALSSPIHLLCFAIKMAETSSSWLLQLKDNVLLNLFDWLTIPDIQAFRQVS